MVEENAEPTETLVENKTEENAGTVLGETKLKKVSRKESLDPPGAKQGQKKYLKFNLLPQKK